MKNELFDQLDDLQLGLRGLTARINDVRYDFEPDSSEESALGRCARMSEELMWRVIRLQRSIQKS